MFRRIAFITFCTALLAVFSSFAAADSPYQVQPLDEAGLERLIENRQGKILFINFWATWCGPCREEFPDLNRLSQLYADDRVEIVAISVDYPDEIDTKIRPFLKKMAPTFPVYVADFEDNEALINRINPDWSGALPASIVYDSLAVARKFHLGKADFETLQRLVESAR